MFREPSLCSNISAFFKSISLFVPSQNLVRLQEYRRSHIVWCAQDLKLSYTEEALQYTWVYVAAVGCLPKRKKPSMLSTGSTIRATHYNVGNRSIVVPYRIIEERTNLRWIGSIEPELEQRANVPKDAIHPRAPDLI
ncbi:hypothetical protein [Microvirga aerophila]|uniref:hypothetical protein n=1 Tax=Microvirga aerophila TaxID=670291 RepID=UPI000DEFAFB9|nr:hypothetical protein [Microvirga aerophila]